MFEGCFIIRRRFAHPYVTLEFPLAQRACYFRGSAANKIRVTVSVNFRSNQTFPCSSVSATDFGGPAKKSGGGRNKHFYMFTVYVLRSLKNNKRYVGITEKGVKERLRQHDSGSSSWTRQNGPFKIIYSEECADKAAALKREKFFKSGQGRRFLDQKIVL